MDIFETPPPAPQVPAAETTPKRTIPVAVIISVIALIVSVAALLNNNPSVTQGDLFTQPPNVDELIDTVSESLVAISCDGSSGTGFAFSLNEGNEEYPTSVITNHHVIEDCIGNVSAMRVYHGDGYDQLAEAMIYGYDEENDLAVLDIAALLPTLSETEEQIRPGHWTMAIGHPVTEFDETLYDSVTFGNILGTDGSYFNYTTSTLNGGNSGGPLINSRGELLGVNTLAVASTEEGIWNFAISPKILCEKLYNC